LATAADITTKLLEHLDMSPNQASIWTDSLTALQWLEIHSRVLQTFVKNRCASIRDQFALDQIRWVPTAQNPADIGTRPLDVATFMKKSEWLQGPAFLYTPRDQWPVPDKVKQTADQSKLNAEIKKATTPPAISDYSLIATIPGENVMDGIPSDHRQLFPVQNYSQFDRLLRQAATILAYVGFLKNKRVIQTLVKTVPNLEQAELALIRSSQLSWFAATWNDLLRRQKVKQQSSLLRLDPFIDTSTLPAGVIRLAGRTKLAEQLQFSARFPLLLHPKSHLTLLIVRHAHEIQLEHIGGANSLLAFLNTKYWIPTPTPLLKRVISSCVICRKRDAVPTVQIMAPLPSYRVPSGERLTPFGVVALDVAGPFWTTPDMGPMTIANRTRSAADPPVEVGPVKRYMLVFRCAAIAAIHIELLVRMDTSAFLLALDNFISLRARPTKIICDRGTNFVRSQKELATLQQTLAEKYRIEFLFGPPRSSHFQGLIERFIKSAKLALVTTMRANRPTEYELASVFRKVAAYLNNLPLAYTHQAKVDFQSLPLCANDFLMGSRHTDLLTMQPNQANTYTNRYRRISDMLDLFWHKLVTHLSSQLRQYSKWTSTARDVTKGDIAVLLDSKLRNLHRLVRVESVVLGADGHVRRVLLYDGEKTFDRSIGNIAIILPFEAQI
jgi:hypothetical protein